MISYNYINVYDIGICSKGTILCPNSSTCIEQNKFCNRVVDCPSGFDENETNCGKNKFLLIMNNHYINY